MSSGWTPATFRCPSAPCCLSAQKKPTLHLREHHLSEYLVTHLQSCEVACGMQVIEGITRALGENIWDNTFVGLTHGRLSSLPDDLTYGETDNTILLDNAYLLHTCCLLL